MTANTDSAAIPWNSQTEDGQVLLGMRWEIFVLGCALLSILNLVLAILIRNPDMHRAGVDIGVDNYIIDPHLTTGADDANRNLAAIGYDDFIQHKVAAR